MNVGAYAGEAGDQGHTVGKGGTGIQGSCARHLPIVPSEEAGQAQGTIESGPTRPSVFSLLPPGTPCPAISISAAVPIRACAYVSGSSKVVQPSRSNQAGPGAKSYWNKAPQLGICKCGPGQGCLCVELAIARQGRWASASAEWRTSPPTGTIKLPLEVKDGSPRHRDADSCGDEAAGLI